MIHLTSSLHRDLKNFGQAALDGDPSALAHLLSKPESIACDLALVLLDLASDHPGMRSELDGWLQEPAARSARITSPLSSATQQEMVCYLLWEHLQGGIQDGLRRARLLGSLPQSGTVLAYVGGLSRCLVISYTFFSDLPELTPVSLIVDPRASFDFLEAITTATPTARSRLKSALGAGHKILWHRGSLIHVDRRHDVEVFGPSIDTLVLAEVLHQVWVESGSDDPPDRVLEIGLGSGMLAVSVLSAFPTSTLVGVDSNHAAVSCAHRNMSCARVAHGGRVKLVTGLFDSSVAAGGFDLVMCNPPYIPLPGKVSQRKSPYSEAVAGTDLMVNVLKSVPALLRPEGKLLMMATGLCMRELKENVPEGFSVVPALGDWTGFPVAFDVEAVLDSQDWLDYLISERGLRREGQTYVHDLQPVWVSR